GFGLVPLATAVARENLAGERSRATIALIGITTAAGIGLGYPFVGLLAQYGGLAAPFWLVSGLRALALSAPIFALPASPRRAAPVDGPGTAMLGIAVGGILLVLAEGPRWGWSSITTLAVTALSLMLAAAWVRWELRAPHPLIELRLLRHR